MKYLQKSNLQLPHLVMDGANRLMDWNGAQCAVLFGLSKSDATNDAVFEMRGAK